MFRQPIQSGLYLITRLRKLLPRSADMGNRPAMLVRHWLHRHASEWFPVRAVFQYFSEHIKPFQINKLLRDEHVGKLLLQHLSIRIADAK